MNVSRRIGTAILLAALLQGCGVLEELRGKAGLSEDEDSGEQPSRYGQNGLPELRLTTDRFESCSALQAEVRAQLVARLENDKTRKAYFAEKVAIQGGGCCGQDAPVSSIGGTGGGASREVADDSASSAAEMSDVLTNVQEQGVDEADQTKIGPHHIFVLRGDQIEVVDRASLEVLGRISVAGYSNPSLYAPGEKLVVLGNKATSKTVCREVEGVASGYVQKCGVENLRSTHALIYDAKAGAVPTLEKEHQFIGNFFQSRVKGDRLFLVLNAELPLKPGAPVDVPAVSVAVDDEGNCPNCAALLDDATSTANASSVPTDPVLVDESGKVAGLDCSQITKPAVADLDFRLTIVHSVPLVDHAAPSHATAIFGGGQHLYMSQEALYVTKAGLHWVPWIAPELSQNQAFAVELARRHDTLVVSKVSLGADGQVEAVATGTVQGRVLGQWAFNEYAESKALAVMTTTSGRWNSFGTKNHLWVLTQDDKDLKVAASIQDFGANETIRAVRYVGNVAYAVTFRQIDPLFAFDMSDPLRPALLGELKIPGFSTYLHPHGEDRLIGIGFDGGIQVSLFDVRDKAALERLDVKILGQSGSSSAATYDHHAFYYDQDSATFALPFQLSNRRWDQPVTDKSKNDSGAIFYKIEKDSLVEIARVSHRDLALGCLGWPGDVSRVFKADGRILTISSAGIKAHDPADLSAVTAKVAFEHGPGTCQQNPSIGPEIID